MKRSRAIDIINNQIEGYMNPSSSRRIAEIILDRLEEQGMLPPELEDKTMRGHFNYEWEKE